MLNKDALQYIVDLSAETSIQNINGHPYSVKSMYRIDKPSVKPLQVPTLTSLLNYIKSGTDPLPQELFISVESPTEVRLLGPLVDGAFRNCYMVAEPMLPSVTLNRFVDTESFIINLQSSFLPNEDTAAILKVVGTITEQDVKTTSDDGVSQTVTAKVGIARVGDVAVPNPVVLAPYRTFQEIEQPQSKFIFRMQKGPQCGLFEADGGAWKITAMEAIRKYIFAGLRNWCEPADIAGLEIPGITII